MSEQYPKLPETAKALQERSVHNRRPIGSHFNPRIEIAKAGRIVYEEPYDPVKHVGHVPNPLSIQKELTGQEQVTYRQSRRPSDIDIIVHADYEDRLSLPWMTMAKDKLQTTIAGSIKAINVGFDDRVYTHAVGDTSRIAGDWLKNTDTVIDTEDNVLAAAEISKLCQNGLTYIISPFRNLPLRDHTGKMSEIIGIKTNHINEIQLQADNAVYSTGEPENPYINTRDAKQLAGWNEILLSRDQTRIDRLGEVGIAVAQVLFEGRRVDATYGFNVPAADRAIAQATRQANGFKGV